MHVSSGPHHAGKLSRKKNLRSRALRASFLGEDENSFCGLPVSVGQKHLLFATTADPRVVLQLLDKILDELAVRENARFIVYKEFDESSAQQMLSLLGLGYRRAECPAMHELKRRFTDFGAYCAALKSHYRNDIARSQRKFERCGLRVVNLYTPIEIIPRYTENVHKLYEAVVARAEIQLEVLPREFFLELVRQFPNQTSLTLIYDGECVVALNWGLRNGLVHHFLFCGMDYSLTDKADIYFNLMFQHLDAAMKGAPDWIEVGQTADMFKARLGCEPRKLFLYVKGCGKIPSLLLRYGWELLFPSRSPIPNYSVFRTEPPRPKNIRRTPC
jgi:predicted N-acyltransferase